MKSIHVLTLAFLLTASLKAEPITYLWTTTANGSIGEVSFTNTTVSIGLYADTDAVTLKPDGFPTVTGKAVAHIPNVGFAFYTQPGTLNVLSAGGLDLEEILRVSSLNEKTYDLKEFRFKTLFAPSLVFDQSNSFSSSLGTFGFKPVSQTSVAFEALKGWNGVPRILTNLASLTVREGAAVRLAPAIEGGRPWVITWRKNGVVIPGNSIPLTITRALESDSGEYTVSVTNAYGGVQMANATLTVTPSKPMIILDPRSQSAQLGANVLLEAAAEGSPEISWQWFFQETSVTDATANKLQFTNITEANLGSYYAVASNHLGLATSAPARVELTKIITWGYPPEMLPSESAEIIAITGGDQHFVAQRRDGRVESWGADARGQASSPHNLVDVASIAAGSTHSLGVRKNGQVAMWGSTFLSFLTEPPADSRHEIAMMAQGVGAQHAIGLRKDGTVTAWGWPWDSKAALSAIPPGATNVVSVAAGAKSALALRSDGTLIAWGNNSYNVTNIPAAATNVIAIASSWFRNYALRADGRVITWGDLNTSLPGSNYVEIAAGAHHVVGLKSDGKVAVGGADTLSRGVLNVPVTATNIAGIGAGPWTSFAFRGEAAPVFTTAAIDRKVESGRNAYFRMWAVGTPPVEFQWNLNGEEIPHATNSWLVVTNVAAQHAGIYTVTAKNAFGSATSQGMGLNFDPVTVTWMTRVGENIQIEIEATAGRSYLLEFKDDVTQPAWQPLAQTLSTGTTATLSDLAGNHRFYRVRRLD
jgi:alpha-tubulin suppressor-like RCC1 family protein